MARPLPAAKLTECHHMPHHDFWSRNVSKKAQREIAATAAAIGVDPRAVNILYNTFFDEDDKLLNWVEDRDVPDADFAFAKAEGLMFDPIRLDHDELIAWVLEARESADVPAISNAFVASLGSGRLDTRSALGSYAHVLRLKRHRFVKDKNSDGCARCGIGKAGNTIDLSARNFRRLKWAGNVEQGDLEYVGTDLHQFAKLAPVSPSDGDIDILRRVLESIRKLPKSAQLSDLNKALTGLFKSTKQERQVVLEILGYAGILKPKGWPSFFDAWVPPSEREEPGHFYKKEWQFPSSGWTGKDGINEDAVSFWFQQIE
ncbi:hypothetical protein [Zavarzinella formosa]|uniref:hypothetical protein n=1 Tax=Zavarzinella formosa TaxID=360055 RepID=UPI0012F9539D|nr:hypothetical protein [Zavarzinella formosa]